MGCNCKKGGSRVKPKPKDTSKNNSDKSKTNG